MQEYKEKYDCEPERRKTTKEYERASKRYKKARKALTGEEKSTLELVREFKDSRKDMMNQHYNNPFDGGNKKIQYNRYADDFVIGVIGSKKDAEKIKEDVKIFLQNKLHLVLYPVSKKDYICGKFCYNLSKTVLEDANMPRYIVTLTDDEIQELKALVQKGGMGYRIKHVQILLKLDQKPENEAWTYDRIKDAYGASHSTIASIAKRFVLNDMEAALGRKKQENRNRKVTGDVEARICTIACSTPPSGTSRWTLQAIADELIRLEVVDYITDSTICEVMKKTKLSRGL